MTGVWDGVGRTGGGGCDYKKATMKATFLVELLSGWFHLSGGYPNPQRGQNCLSLTHAQARVKLRNLNKMGVDCISASILVVLQNITMGEVKV